MRITTKQSHTFAALIRLSTTTHNHLTFNSSEIYHQITRKNSAYWQINTSWLILHLFYSSCRMYGHTVGRPALTLFAQRKALTRIKVRLQFCSRLILFILLLKACSRDQSLSVHLGKANNIVPSVSARIGSLCLFRLFSHNNLTTATFMGQIYNKELNYFCRWMPTGPVYTFRKWILFQRPRVLKCFHWNIRIVRASMRHGEWMCIDQCWSTNKRQSDMWVK